jgi:hypothetical protein
MFMPISTGKSCGILLRTAINSATVSVFSILFPLLLVCCYVFIICPKCQCVNLVLSITLQHTGLLPLHL